MRAALVLRARIALYSLSAAPRIVALTAALSAPLLPRQAAYEARIARVLSDGAWRLLSLLGDRERGCPVPPALRSSLKAFVAARPRRFELLWDAVIPAWKVRLAKEDAPSSPTTPPAMPPPMPRPMARAPPPTLEQPPPWYAVQAAAHAAMCADAAAAAAAGVQALSPRMMHATPVAMRAAHGASMQPAAMGPPDAEAYVMAPNPWAVAPHGAAQSGGTPPRPLLPPGFEAAAAARDALRYPPPMPVPPPMAQPQAQLQPPTSLFASACSLFSSPMFAPPAPPAQSPEAAAAAAQQRRLYEPYVPRRADEMAAVGEPRWSSPSAFPASQAEYAPQALPRWSAPAMQPPRSPPHAAREAGSAEACGSPRQVAPPAGPAAASPRTGKPLPQPRAFALPGGGGAAQARAQLQPLQAPPAALQYALPRREESFDALLDAEARIAALVDTDE